MTRNKGTFNFAANFEVLTKAPLDARLVVDTKSNLTDPAIWEDSNTNVWLYNGIVVSVVSDPTATNNGLYFLTDEANYNDPASWIKVSAGGDSDASGTSSISFQLNNGESGVVLKDSSGNLEVLNSDGISLANITAGTVEVQSLKIDNLSGALYALDGSILAHGGSYPLLGFDGSINGDGFTVDFSINHNLNTLRQNITIYEDNNIVYPDMQRGLNTNIIRFSSAPTLNTSYQIIILGF